MSNDYIKKVSTILLAILGYVYYILPVAHQIFNPTTFWEKLTMLFTVDIISFIFAMLIAGLIVGVVDMIWKPFTN